MSEKQPIGIKAIYIQRINEAKARGDQQAVEVMQERLNSLKVKHVKHLVGNNSNNSSKSLNNSLQE